MLGCGQMLKERILKLKNNILKAKRPPLEPVLTIYVYREGVLIDSFCTADNAEEQRRNYSRLVSIFERYKTDILHQHEDGVIKIIIGKQKNDILYAEDGVKDKNNKKEG